MKKITKEQFVERARAVHGDMYDYSRVVMRGMRNPVEIICPEHGPFMQRPGDHVRGQGCPKCAPRKRVATNMERYGAGNFVGSPEGREKARRTSLERYGTEHPMQNAKVKERHAESVREHFGVDQPLASTEVRAKRAQTMIERHGDEIPMRCADIRAQAQETARERYGVDWAIASDEVKQRINESCQEKFGVDWPMQSPEVRERMRAGLVEKLGVEHALESDEVKAAMVERSQETWGVDWPCQSEDVKQKIRETCRERYGVNWPVQSDVARVHTIETCRERYGVDSVMQCEDFVARAFETRRKNGTLSTSAPEDQLYELLCERFGEEDVVRQYRDARYPFACDFYVRSFDLFIELNASWTHGGHWFDAESDEDQAVLDKWRMRADAGHPFYAAAIETWTVRDVRKRACMMSNGIKVLVFWDNDLADARTWLASLQDDDMIRSDRKRSAFGVMGLTSANDPVSANGGEQ